MRWHKPWKIISLAIQTFEIAFLTFLTNLNRVPEVLVFCNHFQHSSCGQTTFINRYLMGLKMMLHINWRIASLAIHPFQTSCLSFHDDFNYYPLVFLFCGQFQHGSSGQTTYINRYFVGLKWGCRNQKSFRSLPSVHSRPLDSRFYVIKHVTTCKTAGYWFTEGFRPPTTFENRYFIGCQWGQRNYEQLFLLQYTLPRSLG